jgi:hypothetical protein
VKKYDLAEIYYIKALKLVKELSKGTNMHAQIEIDIAWICIKKKLFEIAIKKINFGLKILYKGNKIANSF